MKNRTPTQPVVPAFTPVPRKYRHDGWTPDRQRAFIDALAETGSVKHAARRVNMSSEGAYALRRQPGAEGFRKAWIAALDHGVQMLEDIAIERAIHGVAVPVYSFGKLIGERRHFNDRLLMFILRHRLPRRFGPLKPTPSGIRDEAELRRLWEEEQARESAIDDEALIEQFKADLEQMRTRRLAAQAQAEEQETPTLPLRSSAIRSPRTDRPAFPSATVTRPAASLTRRRSRMSSMPGRTAARPRRTPDPPPLEKGRARLPKSAPPTAFSLHSPPGSRKPPPPRARPPASPTKDGLYKPHPHRLSAIRARAMRQARTPAPVPAPAVAPKGGRGARPPEEDPCWD